MSELDDFLATTLPRQIKAEEAIHNGDVAPRLEMWSRQEPLTLFGAVQGGKGWDQLSRTFHWLAARFSTARLSPPARGWEQVAATTERAASSFRDGRLVGADVIQKHTTPELADVVEIERDEAKVGGRENHHPASRGDDPRVGHPEQTSQNPIMTKSSLVCLPDRVKEFAQAGVSRSTGPCSFYRGVPQGGPSPLRPVIAP
jgi:hypothetical protein